MENLIIGKTSTTPQINLETSGSLLIKGVSTPGDVHTFFQPVFGWLEDYKYTKPSQINLVLDIDYLNTASSKVIVQLLVALNKIKLEGTSVNVTWRYDEGDEDMLELGKDLEFTSNTPIVYVDVKKN
ncbi:MAG: DUF1987 domain-containing protein [Bacteroidia bacterium]|nr:DUF1987 domain-containing protein [Bacteroidia bacterium]